TMMLLKRADSLMPITSSALMRAMSAMAVMLMMPPGLRMMWNEPSTARGAEVSDAGSLMPSSLRKATKYPAHPTATVDAPKRYSRIRSQPMIQATNSPMVAYS